MNTISANTLNEPQSPISEKELLAFNKLPFEAVERIAARNFQRASDGEQRRSVMARAICMTLAFAFASTCSAAELFSAFGRNARIVEAQAKAASLANLRLAGKPKNSGPTLAATGIGVIGLRQ